MSLDVWLKKQGAVTKKGSGIFVREYGQTKQISREEWDAKFPGSEPVVVDSPDIIDDETVYEANITHNLNKMADEAGIYKELWRPDENGITKAAQLIQPLQDGLNRLIGDPVKYKAFNPPNGWGDYHGFVRFVAAYLDACRAYPEAEVAVWR